MNDLVEMLTRMGIQPIGKDEAARPQRRFTEHRIVEPSTQAPPQTGVVGIDLSGLGVEDPQVSASAPGGIAAGDKVVLVFADDQKRVSGYSTAPLIYDLYAPAAKFRKFQVCPKERPQGSC